VHILASELAPALAPEKVLARYQARHYRFARAREELAEALYEAFLADNDGTRALRAGMFRYWQGGRRARAASLALLSGADSRLTSFLAEYCLVAGHGIVRSLGRTVPGRDGRPIGRWRGVRGLVGKSVEKLKRMASRMRGAMRH
jgi:hypothetical protein